MIVMISCFVLSSLSLSLLPLLLLVVAVVVVVVVVVVEVVVVGVAVFVISLCVWFISCLRSRRPVPFCYCVLLCIIVVVFDICVKLTQKRIIGVVC